MYIQSELEFTITERVQYIFIVFYKLTSNPL
jgi:hypothetical protein